MRSIPILDCNIHSQITLAHVTLPKAVPSTVKIFAVWTHPFLFTYVVFEYPRAKIAQGPVSH